MTDHTQSTMADEHRPPVLFLAFASAWNFGPLPDLPAEARALRALLKPLAREGRIAFEILQDVTAAEILDVFQDPHFHGRIALFHYSGHADQYRLLLGESGGVQEVQAAGLAAFLATQANLHLVFLNGCSTEAQIADLLQAGVEAVIATDSEIPDEEAREFATRVYKGLAAGETVAAAYAQADSAHRATAPVRGSSWTLGLHPTKAGAGAWRIPPAPAPLGPTTQIVNQVFLTGSSPPAGVTAGAGEIEPKSVLSALFGSALAEALLTLTATPGGGRVDPAAAAPPRLVPRPRPVLAPPDFVPALVGREQELSALAAALDDARMVEVYGPADVGKTALLQTVAAQAAEDIFPDGILFLQAHRWQRAADVMQYVHDLFYTFAGAEGAPAGALKASDAQIARDLRSLHALIVLDNDPLPKDELEVLLAAFSGCQLLLSSQTTGGRHPGRVWPLALADLPLPAARALYVTALKRPLAREEERGLDAVVAALGGRPGRIVRAAAIARQSPRPGAGSSPAGSSPAVLPAQTADAQASQVLAALTPEQRRLVAALAAVYDASLGQAALLGAADVKSASPALDGLVELEVVRTHSPRYTLVATFVPLLRAAGDAGEWRNRIGAYFETWLRQPSVTPEQMLEEAPALLVLAQQAAAEGRWRSVLELARALEPALITGRQWGAWQMVLLLQLDAAQALGDLGAEGWARHQLGTRALCLGDAQAAQGWLEEALQIRTHLGDRAGMAVSRHNLSLLLPPAPPGGPGPQPPRADPPAGLRSQPPRNSAGTASPAGRRQTAPPPAAQVPPPRLPATYPSAPQRPAAGGRSGYAGCAWTFVLGLAAVGIYLWIFGGSLPGRRVAAPGAVPQAQVSPTARPTTKAPVVGPIPTTPTKTPTPAPAVIPSAPPVEPPPVEPPPVEPPPVEPPPVEPPPVEPPPVDPPPVDPLKEPVLSVPQVTDFQAEPVAIQPGETAVLVWSAPGADYVQIEPAVGVFYEPFGKAPVAPGQSQEYSIVAYNAAGASMPVYFTVEVLPPS
jgi:hypothetical protein